MRRRSGKLGSVKAGIVHTVGRLLLLSFPAAFRGRFSSEVLEYLSQRGGEVRRRDGLIGLLAFWPRAALDLVASALAEHRDGLVVWWRRRTRRLMAKLAPPHAVSPEPGRPSRRSTGDLFETVLQELRFAGRSLAKSPGFTVVAVLTLALGVGANAAIYSVTRAVIWKQLPYPNAERLVTVFHTDLENPGDRGMVTPGNFHDWREQSSAFESMAAWWGWPVSVGGGEAPVRAEMAMTFGSLFDVLETPPLLGRVFTAEADVSGGERVAVISHNFWQSAFGGDADIVGRSVRINDQPATVIGVMPASFRFPNASTQLWLPSRVDTDFRANRTEYSFRAVARLAPGVTPEQAAVAMEPVASRLRVAHPQANANLGVGVAPMRELLVPTDLERQLTLLLGAVGFVLLVASANLAHLMLARAAGRRRDVAVRQALGASHARLVWQALTESLLLALAGGVTGLLLGTVCLRVLLRFLPAEMPRLHEIAFDLPVALFTLVIALGSGLVFGALPALRLPRRQAEVLRAGHRGGSRSRLRGALAVAEVALAVVLLAGAGLLLRSFLHVQQVDPGFATDRLLTLQFNLPGGDEERNAFFFEQIEARVAALPGVKEVGLASSAPFTGTGSAAWFQRLDNPPPAGETLPFCAYRVVTPGYFETLGLELLRGRLPNGRDYLAPGPGEEAAAGSSAVVVNEAAVRRFWNGKDPLGQQIALGPEGWTPPLTVVGVVRDIRSAGLDRDPPATTYMLRSTVPSWSWLTLLVRSRIAPESLANSIRAEVGRLAPDLPADGLVSMEQLRNDSMGSRRVMMGLVSLFATVALILAALGIFGVLSWTVAQRRREMGIRLAVGARNRDVVAQVVREGVGQSALGVTVGLFGAWGLTRFLASQLFEVSPTDPLTYAAVSALLIATAALASYLPARRAASVDITRVLRPD